MFCVVRTMDKKDKTLNNIPSSTFNLYNRFNCYFLFVNKKNTYFLQTLINILSSHGICHHSEYSVLRGKVSIIFFFHGPPLFRKKSEYFVPRNRMRLPKSDEQSFSLCCIFCLHRYPGSTSTPGVLGSCKDIPDDGGSFQCD